MYSFMGGGLFCAIVGNILLVVSTATDYWMQYRLSGNFAHQGLWRYCMSNKCYMQTDSIAYWNATRAFMIMSAMSCFGGIIAGILSFAHFSTFERFNRSFAAGIMFFISTVCIITALHAMKTQMLTGHLVPSPAFFVLLAMAIYTGVTVNFLGKRFGDWRFSWSYVLGWVALLMTFFAGEFPCEILKGICSGYYLLRVWGSTTE
ncbi:lens fiber membrane intrinsic protein-like [Scleropages formosus]|uniref:Lens fiber membrane intrinsic protein-like n=1 Tax=Scleropages formosus TaxID=113540 RepID=A0A0P7V498_SCLFO|nr:lens fiber membrane intrinsic protein-like [Scleropages formosus]